MVGVAGALLLVGAFFLPQEIPLEWYPLNNPGMDINYVEIKCAADSDGQVEILYDILNGYNRIDWIYWPISPTEQTYTYTFPLPDAPIVALRLDPVGKGGTLTVDKMRIINRREEEILRFTPKSITPVHQMASITPMENGGWKMLSAQDSVDPQTDVQLPEPVIPVGMNTRNLKRCLLSTGYLTMMLTILMLAVLTAFWKPSSWRDFFGRVGVIAALAVPLAAIGNRGLIKNSIRYALYDPPPASSRIALELEYQTERSVTAQLFWDVGRGYRGEESSRRSYTPPPEERTLRFFLPAQPIRSLRFDPQDGAGTIRISSMALTDVHENILATVPLDSFTPRNHIASVTVVNGELLIETTPEAVDPILEFTPEAVTAINEVIAAQGRR